MSLLHQAQGGEGSFGLGVTRPVTLKGGEKAKALPKQVTRVTQAAPPLPPVTGDDPPVSEPLWLVQRVALLEDKVAALTAMVNAQVGPVMAGRSKLSAADKQRAYRERKKAS